MTEKDIVYENGNFWVLKEKDGYTVFKFDVTHSVSDSKYEPTPDGLSIAKARCDYSVKLSVLTISETTAKQDHRNIE